MLGLHGRRIAAAQRVTVAILTAATVASCGGGVSPSPPSPIELGIRLGVPVTLHSGARPGELATNDGVATFDLHNPTAQTVRVTHIDGADADSGLIVTYVGFTHCLPSCDKTGSWEDPGTQQILQKGIEGKYPIVVPPDDPSKLSIQITLRLGVSQAVMDRFRAGCLWLRGLRVTLSDGRHVELRAYDGLSILGVFAETSALPAPSPPGPDRCPLGTPTPGA